MEGVGEGEEPINDVDEGGRTNQRRGWPLIRDYVVNMPSKDRFPL